jgi:hypothetical protein
MTSTITSTINSTIIITITSIENYFVRSVLIAVATEHVYIQGLLTSHDTPCNVRRACSMHTSNTAYGLIITPKRAHDPAGQARPPESLYGLHLNILTHMVLGTRSTWRSPRAGQCKPGFGMKPELSLIIFLLK